MEKILVLVRHRVGHTCNRTWVIIAIVDYEGLGRTMADHIYDFMADTALPSVLPAEPQNERRCAYDPARTCTCQGTESSTCGQSYSFGCSYNIYVTGCKLAMNEVPNKYRSVVNASVAASLQTEMDRCADLLAKRLKRVLPECYANMTAKEDVGGTCRLGTGVGRPWSGVTVVADFCAHAHTDINNLENGCTAVLSLTRSGRLNMDQTNDNEQLHVLTKYIPAAICKQEVSHSEEVNTGIQCLQPLIRRVLIRTKRVPTKNEASLRLPVQASTTQLPVVVRSLQLRCPPPVPTPVTPPTTITKLRVAKSLAFTPRKISPSTARVAKSLAFTPRKISPSTARGRLPVCPSTSRTLFPPSIIQASLPTTVVKVPVQPSATGVPIQFPHIIQCQKGPLPSFLFNANTRVTFATFSTLTPVRQPSTVIGIPVSPSAIIVRMPLHQPFRFRVPKSLSTNPFFRLPFPLFKPVARFPGPPSTLRNSSTPSSSTLAQSPVALVGPTDHQHETHVKELMAGDSMPKAKYVWQNRSNVAHFANPAAGGVALALPHGSILYECSKKEQHATTPLPNPDRTKPSRIGLVFYQHQKLDVPEHSRPKWLAKKECKRRERIERNSRNALRLENVNSLSVVENGGNKKTTDEGENSEDKEENSKYRGVKGMIYDQFGFLSTDRIIEKNKETSDENKCENSGDKDTNCVNNDQLVFLSSDTIVEENKETADKDKGENIWDKERNSKALNDVNYDQIRFSSTHTIIEKNKETSDENKDENSGEKETTCVNYDEFGFVSMDTIMKANNETSDEVKCGNSGDKEANSKCKRLNGVNYDQFGFLCTRL